MTGEEGHVCTVLFLIEQRHESVHIRIRQRIVFVNIFAEIITKVVLPVPADGEGGHSAVAAQLRRNSLEDPAVRSRNAERCEIAVGVDINKTGRQIKPGSVYDPAGPELPAAAGNHGRDKVAADGRVAGERRRSGAVDNRCVFNQNIIFHIKLL